MFDYFNLKPLAFGLDISDLSLKIAKLGKSKKFFKLAAFGETEIRPGVISGGEIQDSAALTQVIKAAVKNISMGKLDTNYVVASLPEEKSFLQVIKLPKMKEEEVQKAIYFEAENYVPLPIDQVYLDFQIMTPPGGHLDHTDVLIAGMVEK